MAFLGGTEVAGGKGVAGATVLLLKGSRDRRLVSPTVTQVQ